MSRQALPSHLHFPTTEKKDEFHSYLLQNNTIQIHLKSLKPLWNKKKPRTNQKMEWYIWNENLKQKLRNLHDRIKINFTITYNNNRSSNPDSNYNKFDEN